MSGTLPLREAAVAAIAARLTGMLPDVLVERSAGRHGAQQYDGLVSRAAPTKAAVRTALWREVHQIRYR